MGPDDRPPVLSPQVYLDVAAIEALLAARRQRITDALTHYRKEHS